MEKEIEDIAWQLFLNRMNIRFKRELTSEEKKGITDVDTYEYYRQEAKKVLKKRERALLDKKYPVIEIPADGKSGMNGGAYCLCFVYSKYDGNFVLKGYMREVKEYLKKSYTHYFYNLTLWHNGISRNIWYFWKENIGIFDVSIKERRNGKKTQIRPYSFKLTDDERKEIEPLYFRRLPKRWIPEFDKY